MTTPNQFGPPTNIWAMLNTLKNNNIGVYPYAGIPTDGASGTYAGFVGPGGVIVNTSTGIWYINVGTLAVPSYRAIGIPPAGSGGLGMTGVAKMSYSAAVDGLAQGTITPSNSPTLPANAIILGGVLNITTALTSGGSATIALGLGSGAQVASLKGATAVASWGIGFLALLPLFTAASYVKVAAATRLTLTVATADLLTGIFDLNVLYVQGNA